MLNKLLLACLCCAMGGGAAAQPPAPPHGRWDEPVGQTVADRPSALYRFERHQIDSEDGKRHYRIEISIPLAPAPKAGYPVLYMLDGNAAMDTLRPEDLASLSRRNPPVLVAIGYDVPTRNDVISRAYDYTPPVYRDGKRVEKPVVLGREGGGADIFLKFIQTRVKPLVRKRVNVDSGNESLWGHSYGGLFVLHTLFTQPDAFDRYIAGDPSAWWHDGVLVREWRAFDKQRAAGRQVSILVGTKPRNTPPPGRTHGSGPRGGGRTDQRGAVREMAEGLREGGADVYYRAFPRHGHGDMIRVSLERALEVSHFP